MWSPTIVISQEGAQRSPAPLRGGIGHGVRLFPQERLDKSLRFPIRPRGVGSRPRWRSVQGVAGAGKARDRRPLPLSLRTRRTRMPRVPNQATVRVRNAAHVVPSWCATSTVAIVRTPRSTGVKTR
jgi:hypothetical protein